MIVIDTLSSKHFKITFPYDKDLVAIIQELPNRVFDKKNKWWKFPIIDLFILIKILKENNLTGSITKEAKEKHAKIMAGYEDVAKLAALKECDYKPRNMEIQLYPFQEVGVNFLNKINDAVLGFEMGLGKTCCSMSSASDSIMDFGYKNNLIVCPSSLKYEWAFQLGKFSKYSYTVVSGNEKIRQSLYKNNTNFTIVNYDVIWRDKNFIKEIDWDLIICDEIQRIRNNKTAAHKTLTHLRCKRKIGLTGTLLENKLVDLFNVMKFINKDIFGTTEMSFKNRYCEMDYWGNVKGYKNLDEVNKKLSYVMMRRRKVDVLKELPKKVVKNYYIELNQKERTAYNRIKKGIIEDQKSGKLKKIDILTRIVYLRQACDCLNLVEDHDAIISSKLDELKRILEEEFPLDMKIVIFSEYAKMTKIIQDNIGYSSVRLHGGVKNECRWEKEIEKQVKSDNKEMADNERDVLIYEEKKKAVCKNCPYYNDDTKCYTRKKLINKFNNDPSIKLFISTNAGKEGLNLQIASTVIHFDRSFNQAVNEQRSARVDRIGQLADTIFEINLTCLNSVDERVRSVNDDKQRLFDKVIDGVDNTESIEVPSDLNLDNLGELL